MARFVLQAIVIVIAIIILMTVYDTFFAPCQPAESLKCMMTAG